MRGTISGMGVDGLFRGVDAARLVSNNVSRCVHAQSVGLLLGAWPHPAGQMVGMHAQLNAHAALPLMSSCFA
jgi:hypothetical protein